MFLNFILPYLSYPIIYELKFDKIIKKRTKFYWLTHPSKNAFLCIFSMKLKLNICPSTAISKRNFMINITNEILPNFVKFVSYSCISYGE